MWIFEYSYWPHQRIISDFLCILAVLLSPGFPCLFSPSIQAFADLSQLRSSFLSILYTCIYMAWTLAPWWPDFRHNKKEFPTIRTMTSTTYRTRVVLVKTSCSKSRRVSRRNCWKPSMIALSQRTNQESTGSKQRHSLAHCSRKKHNLQWSYMTLVAAYCESTWRLHQ